MTNQPKPKMTALEQLQARTNDWRKKKLDPASDARLSAKDFAVGMAVVTQKGARGFVAASDFFNDVVKLVDAGGVSLGFFPAADLRIDWRPSEPPSQDIRDELVRLVQTYGATAFQQAVRNCYSVDLTGDLTNCSFLIPGGPGEVVRPSEPQSNEIELPKGCSHLNVHELSDKAYYVLSELIKLVKNSDNQLLGDAVSATEKGGIWIGSTTFIRATKKGGNQ